MLVERKWGRRGKILGRLALEGRPNEMDDPQAMTTLRDLHPEIEPYASGRLRADEIHSLYWEECGNPKGIPVVFLHGGPGGGCSATSRRYFDRGGCGECHSCAGRAGGCVCGAGLAAS